MRNTLPLLLLPLAACGSASNQAPPREVTPLAIPSQASAIAVPISARLRDLEKIANRVVPATLATIDKKEPACLKLKIIGKVGCHIVGKVTLYPTGDGRLAIGLAMAVATLGRWIDVRGTIWATAKPYNQPGSQRIEIHDLRIAGEGSGTGFKLLLAVAQAPAVQAEIGPALSQNFAKDCKKLLGKAGAAIAEKRLGDFVLTAHIDQVENGIVYPAGQGLFMAVAAQGTAALRYEPKR